MVSHRASVSMAHLSMCLDRTRSHVQLRRVKHVDFEWLLNSRDAGIFLINARMYDGPGGIYPSHYFVRDTFRDLFYVSPVNIFSGDVLRSMTVQQAQDVLKLRKLRDVRLLTTSFRPCNKVQKV